LLSAAQLNRCLDENTKVQKLENNEYNQIDIKDIEVGDIIKGVTNVEVLHKEYTKSKGYKIVTKSGKEIICSSNHRFPTENGLSSIENGLKIGDKLASNWFRSLYS